MSPTITPSLRQLVQERGNWRCEYCQTSERLTGYSLEIDHIIPQARQGPSTADNLCLCCRRCNASKGYRVEATDPQTQQVAHLFNPRLHHWPDHFTWSDDGSEILGLTPSGRATVALLQMNHTLIIRARTLWVRAGWHPPAG